MAEPGMDESASDARRQVAASFRLDGRVALVRGGTRGIGRAIVGASAWVTGQNLIVDGGRDIS